MTDSTFDLCRCCLEQPREYGSFLCRECRLDVHLGHHEKHARREHHYSGLCFVCQAFSRELRAMALPEGISIATGEGDQPSKGVFLCSGCLHVFEYLNENLALFERIALLVGHAGRAA